MFFFLLTSLLTRFPKSKQNRAHEYTENKKEEHVHTLSDNNNNKKKQHKRNHTHLVSIHSQRAKENKIMNCESGFFFYVRLEFVFSVNLELFFFVFFFFFTTYWLLCIYISWLIVEFDGIWLS